MNNKWYRTAIVVLTLGLVVGVISYIPKGYYPVNPFHSCSATYVSGTGTAGTANTAQTIITRSMPANTLRQNGDRVRIRVYLFSAVAASITITVKVNGVSVAAFGVATPSIPDVIECYLHYIDDTHANILENEITGIGALSAVNVAGFAFTSNQNITIEQTAVVNNFATIYGVFVDVLPKFAQ